MIIFGLYIFAILIMLGGLSINVARNEYSRIRLQSVTDTAILAAADLDQTLDPETVVRDYFDKAGLLSKLDSVSVQESINSRQVSANTTYREANVFTIGNPASYTVSARGTAREEISDIEVSLVLDVSGSMGSYGRLGYLQDAAKDFADTVLSLDDTDAGSANEVSLSVIPYSTQVAMPDELLAGMNLQFTHDYSNCVDFNREDFLTTSLPLRDPDRPSVNQRNQTAHFDPFSNSVSMSKPVCRTDTAFNSTPLNQSIDAVQSQIDDMEAEGNTSIDTGIKWGVALLDPSTRNLVDTMIDNGKVNADFSGRPFDFNRPNTMKVLVVMTDGENTSQYRLRNDYNDGLSDIWLSGSGYPNGTNYSVEYDGYGGDYYIPRYGSYRNDPIGNNPRQLNWQEVWSQVSIYGQAYWLRGNENWSTKSAWNNNPVWTVNNTEKDSRMSDICTAAKGKGILIFAVGVEIDADNAAKMRSCASSSNHYFDVQAEDMDYAFSAIANTINQLRLVR